MPNYDGTGPRENPMSNTGIGAQKGLKKGFQDNAVGSKEKKKRTKTDLERFMSPGEER